MEKIIMTVILIIIRDNFPRGPAGVFEKYVGALSFVVI